MNWPSPNSVEDLFDWARTLVSTLAAFEQSLRTSTETGKVAEFIKLPTTGWLPADGSTFSAESYPALSVILGGNTLPNLTPQYDPANIVAIKT